MRRLRSPFLLLLAGSLALPLSGRAQGVEDEVRAAATTFVDAFNDLDWERFSASWAEDATAFFPAGVADARIEGRAAIVQGFQAVFADFPVTESDPPYLSIEPRDLEVAVFGEAAVVSFHLGDLPTQNRRTLVFVNRGGRWLIVHLHASAGR